MDQSVITNADLTRKLINSIQDDISDKDFKEGISFLDVKNDTILSYLIDVCNIVLRKIKEESIADHASVDRCIEYRVMLEKMKAIDQKLTYQINKLIALPENAEAQISERVNVQNLDIELDSDSDYKDDDDDDGEDEDKVSDGDEISPSEDLGEHEGDGFAASKHDKKNGPDSKGVYKPPKLKSAVYSDDVPSKRGRFEDDFEFESDNEIFDGLQMNSEEKARLDYEEDNFTRLKNSNAKQKQKQKQKKGKKLKKRRH